MAEIIKKHKNIEMDYTIRLYEHNGYFFISVNFRRVAMFETLVAADARYSNLINHVSPKVHRWNPAAFDPKTAWLEDKNLSHAEEYQF